MRCLAPLLLAAVCASAEVARRDLILAYEVADGGFTYTLGTAIGDFTGEDAFDRITTTRLGGRWAWSTAGGSIAPLFGLDAEWIDAPLGQGGMDGYGLSLTAGGTWALGEPVAVDAELFAGLQRVALDLPGGAGSAALSADGQLQRSGLRVRVLWHPFRHWSLAAEGGWSGWSGDLTGDDGRGLQLDGSGLCAGLALAWRPSARPGGVE